MSVNKVILVGHLGADPEVRYMPNGDPVANLRIATTDRYRDKASGEMREQTEWHRVIFFRRLAEVAEAYTRKGSQIYVEGRLRTRRWTDQSGVEKYTTEIIGDTLQLLGKAPESTGQRGTEGTRRYRSDSDDQDSDVPF